MQEQLEGAIPLVTVGFSPLEALGPLADHLGLHGRILSNPDRALYRLLGLRRAPIWFTRRAPSLTMYRPSYAGRNYAG